MSPAPVQPVQPLQALGQFLGYPQQQMGISGYEANVPGAAEVSAGSDLGVKPFAGSRLIAAQMERQAGIDEQNRVAQAAAVEQARQFDAEQKNKMLQMQYGALNTPFGGEAARGIGEADPGSGWDTGRIEGIEQQAKDAAAATIFGTNAGGLANISQAGGDVGQAASKVPGMEGVSYGATPAERASTADNATSLDVARIGAAASMYGSDQQLKGAQAAAKRGKFTVGLPPQQAAVYGPVTIQVDTMEEAMAAQQQMARQYGGAVIGGGPIGTTGQPGEGATAPTAEVPLTDPELRSSIPNIDAGLGRRGWTRQGPPLRRPDGTMVVKARKQDGSVVEVPVREVD